MSEWRRFEVSFEMSQGVNEDALFDALCDVAADHLADGTWTACVGPTADPDPECICPPSPPNSQIINSACPKHAGGWLVNQ